MGFAERFPRWSSGVLGLIMLVLTVAIIGLEVGSAYIDLAHGTIWVGFWCGLIFLKTCLMMLFITCCCRGRCCATYVLIFTVLSGVLACVVIYFDQIFIKDLCKCYLGNQLCCAVRGIESFRANYTAILEECGRLIINPQTAITCPAIPYDKLKLIQAQLGCAVGMLVTCAIYVVIYMFACLGICFGHD